VWLKAIARAWWDDAYLYGQVQGVPPLFNNTGKCTGHSRADNADNSRARGSRLFAFHMSF
jgi:hypothetical protein